MNDDTPPPERLDTTDTILPEAHTGQTIGNYRILQQVGEGGMGEVYEAEQERPVRRRVALKIVKRGMDTRQVVARFESERQALALMDHPSIARVLDAGATERGRPFFVMEFVRGEPITTYCDKYRLRTRDRLRLFVQVCDGVQHAHQKGIIHRDIKPSNVLVQIEGDRPVPKIIDFGVAKATQHGLGDHSAHTQIGQLVGTPEYMSPEQAELTAQDIDTRADVYSLGALLYELLVGALPFDPAELRRAGFDEFRRKIREVEPPRPSLRLTTLGVAATPAAKNRGTEPAALAKRLKGDLDWITLKALEKDRTRRYGSPAELAADIVRHLENQPVAARPPSGAYRAGKFVRRHRVGVASAAALALLLVAFAAAMALQARRIAVQYDRANQEAAAANRVTQVLTELFDLSDPGAALGNNITARELLDIGLPKARSTLAGQPRELASALVVIGENYRRLGLYDRALPLLEEALALRRGTLGEDDPATLAAGAALAKLLREQGRYEDAESLYLRILEQQRRVLGADDPATLASKNQLAGLYWNLGRYADAERLLLETLDRRRGVLGAAHADTAESMNDLGVLYRDQGQYERAEPLLAEALEIRRRALSADHPDVLVSLHNLALLYADLGRQADAEPLYEEVVEKQRRVLGLAHRDTLTAMNSLAALNFAQGRYEAAESLYREVLESQRKLLGADHPDTLGVMGNLGDLYTRQGRLSEAQRLLTEALAGCRRELPANHPVTAVTLRKYGSWRTAMGRFADAEETLLEAHGALVESFGATHEQTLKAVKALVELYERWAKPEHAAQWRRVLEGAGPP